MNIIPGAAYLSPTEQKVYLAAPDGDLLTLFEDFSIEEWVHETHFPGDLILLYAPGDEIEDRANERQLSNKDAVWTTAVTHRIERPTDV